jgi:two-component system OmpR family response regulator
MKDSMRQTALIVEDDPGTRHVLSSTLATAGIDSIHAATGAAMWRRLDPPDIIILDLSLPDGDGLELLRQLRQTSDVPVLIHSRRSDEIERIIGIEIGADDFMPKPCNMRELLARVAACFAAASAANNPAAAATCAACTSASGPWIPPRGN